MRKTYKEYSKKATDEFPNTRIYYNLKEICEKWNQYWQTRNNQQDSSLIQIFVNAKSDDIIAIEDDSCMTEPEVFLFQTDYLPLALNGYITEAELSREANNIRNLFLGFIEKLKLTGPFPLFLISWNGTNEYVAWSLTEAKYIKVYNRKTNFECFRISGIQESINAAVQNVNYTILFPPNELIEILNLNICTDM